VALGTVTLIKKGVIAPGGLRFAILEFIGPASYTADGEAIALSNFPKFQDKPIFTVISPTSEAAGATNMYYERSSGKILAFDAATGVEEAAAQNLSTMTYRMFALGV
jgi:hypothetical protein